VRRCQQGRGVAAQIAQAGACAQTIIRRKLACLPPVGPVGGEPIGARRRQAVAAQQLVQQGARGRALIQQAAALGDQRTQIANLGRRRP